MDDDPVQANGQTWTQDQKWEADWWGDCTNTFSEENKQITYAHRMGLVNEPDPYTGAWPSYDLAGRSVLDIGGGPVSILLKCRNRGRGAVVDPCAYPYWIHERYFVRKIEVRQVPAEQLVDPRDAGAFDEAWIYNCLQHTLDPEAIVANARRVARVVRVFEWIDQGVTIGHPQNLTAAALNDWFGASGTVEQMNENGCTGRAWHGAFPQC